MRRLVLAMALGLFMIAASPTAVTAAPTAHAPRFVGTYRSYVYFPQSGWKRSYPMKVRADGTGFFDGPGSVRYKFVWSNQQNTITTFCEACGHVTMYGNLTRGGIARRNAPGTYGSGGTGAFWYAVRKRSSRSSAASVVGAVSR